MLMPEAMLANDAAAQCSKHCKSSNPRTYARTHKELLTSFSEVTLRLARRGAEQSTHHDDQNRRTADAARGQAVPNA